MGKPYAVVGLGGTFDHFHVGHQHFLSLAVQFGQHLHLGLTHPKLSLNKPWAELIEPYTIRQKSVEKYCRQQKISVAIMQLNDVYGPTLDEKSKIQVLIVTEETVAGADQINQTRKTMKLPQLQVQVCPLLRDKTGAIISAERIRGGEINRAGMVYRQLFTSNLELSTKQRQVFAQPQGESVQKPSNETGLICVVGDSSLKKFIKNDWTYNLGVYDKRERRQPVNSPLIEAIRPELKTTNPAGQISTTLVTSLQQALDTQVQHLFVQGEEDLTAVALVLLLPLGARVYYGQPQKDLIELVVNEALKNKFYSILNLPSK